MSPCCLVPTGALPEKTSASWPTPLSHMEKGLGPLVASPGFAFPSPSQNIRLLLIPSRACFLKFKKPLAMEPWAPPQPQIHSLPSLLDYFLLVTGGRRH